MIELFQCLDKVSLKIVAKKKKKSLKNNCERYL